MTRRLLTSVNLRLLLAALMLLTSALLWRPVHAVRGLPNRSLTLGTSEASADTTYEFQFDITFSDPIGSVRFEFCANNPIPFTACTPPTGFDVSGAAIANQTGETGFSIDPGVTANDIVLTRTAAPATPQTVSYTLDPVTNPDAAGSYYVRVHTYSSEDGTGSTVEENGIAFATVETFDVTAEVPPFLLFCVGISIAGNDCANASGNLIDFGTLDSSAPNVATSQMVGGTNGVGGLAITVLGTTMTSGINTIQALNGGGTSAPGTAQFGINLRNNTIPNAGLNPSGPGTTVPTANYNIVNQFRFNSGDIIAASPLPTNFNTLTATYLVNIPSTQAPGVYTATLSFVATATF